MPTSLFPKTPISDQNHRRRSDSDFAAGPDAMEVDDDLPEPAEAYCTDEHLVVTLAGGVRLVTPLRLYPRLQKADARQRNAFELSPFGVHWPEIDEDLSIEGMLKDLKAMEDARARHDIDSEEDIIMADTEKFPPEKNLPAGYRPPKVWSWDKGNGGEFASINRPVAGATHEKVLPVGRHPLQLYSLGTPNGVKVTILLEELLAAGHRDAEYDAWLIQIGEGDQFGSGFVAVNPNSKIPALLDRAPKGGGGPVRVFESGSILLYLAEKFGAFLPEALEARTETLNWLFWQMGSAPFVGGGFGHFYAYAPIKIEYAINRYAMEAKRQLDVLDRHLADREFMAGSEYTIADMAIWPWYGLLAANESYQDAGTFLSTGDYANVQRWRRQVGERPAVKRGRMVNRTSGEPASQLRERHDASDFGTGTQDKVAQDKLT